MNLDRRKNLARISTKAYSIDYELEAVNDLADLRVYDARRVIDELGEQLRFAPLAETRRRKALRGPPPWDAERPAWELRVGEFRVFYDVDPRERRVVVRRVRRKGRSRSEEVW